MHKVACVGAGYFSQFHIDGWRRIDGVSLVGVSDLDCTKAIDTGLPVYESLEQMLSETEPHIVDIILPPKAHAEAIRDALNFKPQAIICQKPFCTSLEEAREITECAKLAGTALIIHENFRFQPWYRAIKAALDEGRIGKILQATFRLRPGDGQGADAYLDRQPYFREMERFLVHETGVHWVDTFRYLFGNPVAVYADLRRVNPAIKGEDAGIITFDHTHDIRAILDANRHLDHAANNTRCTMGEGFFEGTEGTLSLYGDGSVHLRKFGSLQQEEILPPDASNTFGGDCTHLLQAHVYKGITKGMLFENTAEEYLDVIEIEHAVYKSSEEKRKIELDFYSER